MSAKSYFLQKLQARQPAPASSGDKSQADITAFRLQMVQLQKQMEGWLEGTGLNIETFMASVTDLLLEGGGFNISGIVLRYEDRSVTFTPLFLYGPGVTGCVEATCHTEGQQISLGRLFMRSDILNDWSFTPPDALSHPGKRFEENTFFGLIIALVP